MDLEGKRKHDHGNMNRATCAQNEQPVIVCSSNLFTNFVERGSCCHQGLSRFPQRKATKSFTNIHGFGSNQITFQASVKLWRFGGLKISALDSKPRGLGSRSGRVLNSLSLPTQEYMGTDELPSDFLLRGE